MKLYKREIKPMVDTGSFHITCNLLPAPGFDNWYPEEKEVELREYIENSYPNWILVFYERFVEVKTGEWLSLGNDNVMSLVPMYKCSICGNSFSGYYPPDVCECCGAKMK